MRARFLGLLLPPTVWLAFFLLVPTAVLAVSAFTPEGLERFGDPVTWRLLGRSLWIAAASTVLCLVVAYPVAAFIAGSPPRRRNLLLFLVVLPFWTNMLIRIYALKTMLIPLDLTRGQTAVIFGIFHSFLPFMILPVYASLEKVDRRVLDAARDLGASPVAAFWKVTFPLTLPGVAAGCLLVFVPALGIFALPELFEGSVRMIGSQIEFYFKENHPREGSALTLILMLFTIGMTWLYTRLRRTEGLV